MRFSFWSTPASPGVAIDPAGPVCVFTLAFAAVLALTATDAAAEPMPCSVKAIAYEALADVARISVTLGCGEVGEPVPVDTDLVAGMTVYGAALVGDNVVPPDPADLPPNPANAERIVISDELTDHYDFEAQVFRLPNGPTEQTLTFTAPKPSVEDKHFLLFAIWPIEAKEECDQGDEAARPGCREFGYTLGWNLDSLIYAYPGKVFAMMRAPADYMEDYEVERWVVERYR